MRYTRPPMNALTVLNHDITLLSTSWSICQCCKDGGMPMMTQQREGLHVHALHDGDRAVNAGRWQGAPTKILLL